MTNFFETNDVASAGSSNSGGDSIAPGVYADLGEIVGGRNLSGKPLDFMGGKTFDIAIELEINVGKSFNPSVTIIGNYKRDGSGNIVGWGAVFKLANLFTDLGINGKFNADGSVPPAMLKQLVGRKVYRASYVSGSKGDGKLKYTNYDRLVPEESGVEGLKTLWEEDRKAGFPKNYKPQLLNGKGGSAGGFTTEAEQQLIPDDDDLPF